MDLGDGRQNNAEGNLFQSRTLVVTAMVLATMATTDASYRTTGVGGPTVTDALIRWRPAPR